MKTLILVLLDESGSMAAKRADVIGGFNTFLEEQQAMKFDSSACRHARLAMVKFNTVARTVMEPTAIDAVPPLSEADYTPGGGTALFDAIATGFSIADMQKQADERAVMLIMTDGQENSSRETTKAQVKELIAAHEAKGDWTIVYIGAAPDEWLTEMGTHYGNTVAYSTQDPRKSWVRTSSAMSAYRISGQSMTESFYDPNAQAKKEKDTGATGN